MSNTNNKRVDLWEVGGRVCLNLGQAAIIAIGFEAVIYKEQTVGRFFAIAGAIACVCFAIAIVCFAVYNKHNNNH